MGIVNFESKDLEKIVRIRLNKNYGQEVTNDELIKIQEMIFSKSDITGRQTDINLDEIDKFPGLTETTIKGFNIDKDKVSLLKKQKKLNNIHFEQCEFEQGLSLDMKLQYLEINQCKGMNGKLFENLKLVRALVVRYQDNFDLSNISNLSKIKMLYIEDCDNVQLNDIDKLKDLGALYLKGLSIDNLDELYNLKKLEYLNLDGTELKHPIDKNRFKKHLDVNKEESNYPLERT